MSLSSINPLARDRYVAVLAPDGVSVVRRRPGGACDLLLDEAVTPPAGAGGDDLALAAADALGRLLGRPGVGTGRLGVLLSSHFVRFQLLPWRDEIGSAAELASYAQISFEQVYGGIAASWTPLVSPEAAGRPRLAAAVSSALLERLGAVADAAPAPLALDSVQPYLTAAFNRLARRDCGDDFLFVLAEPARTSTLSAAAGYWQSVRVSAGDDDPVAVAALIDRERHLAGAATAEIQKIVVHSPGRPGLRLPELSWGGVQVLDVDLPDGLAPAPGARLAMAMALL